MFHIRRRYLVFIVAAVLPPASLAIGVYLRFSSPSSVVILLLLVVMLALSCLSSYYHYLKPFRELSSAVLLLLDSVGQRIIDLAESEGIETRLNYLAIYRPWQRLFLVRYFRVAWGLGMRYQPDNAVRFGASKGVAGAALRSRRSTLVNMELLENRNYGGFSDEEKTIFPALTAIWSVPIFELDQIGNATGTILGTINLDSKTPGAWAVLTVNQDYERLLEELQDLVSKVASC